MRQLNIYTILILIAALSISAGCGFIPTTPIMERPEVAKLLSEQDLKPIQGKTMIGFFHTKYNREEINENRPENEYFWIPEFEIEKETDELAKIVD
jgi:hypothetical protein